VNLGSLGLEAMRRQLAGNGLALRIAPLTVRVRSRVPHLPEQIFHLYQDHAVADAADFADIDVRMFSTAKRHSWRHATQVQFVVDGTTPFDPFPSVHALPMFEWGLNWVFAHRMHDHLLLHAAVLARDDRAILLPAWPGSGKSTLAASLACRGWRYLSDEFGVVRFAGSEVVPFVRPTALKNESIDVMRQWVPPEVLGDTFVATRKGTVVHCRPPSPSVAQGAVPATIVAVVFPDFKAGAPVRLLPLPQAATFLKLAGNAFNYEVVGERGFRTVARIVRTCDSCILQYGDLADAHAAIEEVFERALKR
jgi:HprK-related kinase A